MHLLKSVRSHFRTDSNMYLIIQVIDSLCRIDVNLIDIYNRATEVLRLILTASQKVRSTLVVAGTTYARRTICKPPRGRRRYALYIELLCLVILSIEPTFYEFINFGVWNRYWAKAGSNIRVLGKTLVYRSLLQKTQSNCSTWERIKTVPSTPWSPAIVWWWFNTFYLFTFLANAESMGLLVHDFKKSQIIRPF